MIFATVGTHTAPFDRFVSAVDDLAAELDEPVLLQVGVSKFPVLHAQAVDFLSTADFESALDGCRLLVTHGGATVLSGLRRKVPIVAIPRRRKFREHIDDHQVQFVRALARRGLVTGADPKDVSAAIKRARSATYDSHLANLVDALRAAIVGGLSA